MDASCTDVTLFKTRAVNQRLRGLRVAGAAAPTADMSGNLTHSALSIFT